MIKNFKESNYFLHMVNKKKADLIIAYHKANELCEEVVNYINNNRRSINREYMMDYFSEVAFKKWCLIYLLFARLDHADMNNEYIRAMGSNCTYCALYVGDSGFCHYKCPLFKNECNSHYSPWYKVDRYSRSTVFSVLDKRQALNSAGFIADICYNDMMERIG